MNVQPQKILALQFKYFGDAVLMTPALRALREHFPQSEIHLLVSAEIAPLFQHLPWLTRVWALPRRRGSASLRVTWPLIRALRRERFDRSVDFASNDRGAILSLLIGAKHRLGWDEHGGFWGRRYLYNQRVAGWAEGSHESLRLARLLSGWQISPPPSLEAEIHADPSLVDMAKQILPDVRTVICHVASSQQKKEWPLARWAEFHRLATADGHRVVFTTPRGEREAALMAELKKLAPAAMVLPQVSELPLFLAVLARARVFISGDTGPLHFAAGLGVPTISLFGPTSPARWAPIGARHQVFTGGGCDCDGNSAVCCAGRHCLAEILPAQVLTAVEKALGNH
ncbi:MAG: glycosyltransferase family 9 protein [Verrucomicrobiota bacterium]